MALKRDSDKPMLPSRPADPYEPYKPTADDIAAGKEALKRIRRMCSFRPTTDKRAWAKKIIERHAKGEYIAPIALQAAREAIAKAAHADEMRETEEELRKRGPVEGGTE